MESVICRICLAANIRMHPIVNTELQHVYEKLSEYMFVKETRPLSVCYLCYARLKNCHRLMLNCRQSEEILLQMINSNQKHFRHIDKQYQSNTLSMTAVTLMDIIDEDISRSDPGHVKVEPAGEDNDSVEVKVEFEDYVADPLEGTSHSYGQAQADPLDDDKDLATATWTKKCGTVETSLKDECTRSKLEVEIDETKINHNTTTPVKIEKKQKRTKHSTKSKEAVATSKDSTIDNIDSKGDYVDSAGPAEISESSTDFKNKFQCDVCFTTLSNKKTLLAHIRSHTISKPHKCSTCHTTFRDKYDLNKHIRVHTGERPHKCDVCQASFSSKSYLSNHARLHTGDKRYKCNLCESSFVNKTNLESHVRTHTGEKPFKCDVCQASFRQNNHLRSHIRRHTGERPHKCNFCHKNFTYKASLSRHLLIHTAEKIHKCDICPCEFSNLRDLKGHIRKHPGVRRHECTICHAKFTKESHLNRHKLVHTGEKPFTCDICQCSFSLKFNLSKHILIHARVDRSL